MIPIGSKSSSRDFSRVQILCNYLRYIFLSRTCPCNANSEGGIFACDADTIYNSGHSVLWYDWRIRWLPPMHYHRRVLGLPNNPMCFRWSTKCAHSDDRANCKNARVCAILGKVFEARCRRCCSLASEWRSVLLMVWGPRDWLVESRRRACPRWSLTRKSNGLSLIWVDPIRLWHLMLPFGLCLVLCESEVIWFADNFTGSIIF